MKTRTALIAVVFVLTAATMASACGRCGLFGRKCRYSCSHYVATAYVAPPSYSTNFVFNNLVPSQFPYLLAPQGQSIYGVQTASYQDSSALYMDRAGRFADQAFALATTAQTGYQENAALAIQANADADRRHTNAQIAMLAMEANRGTTQQQFTVQVNNGRMSIVQPQEVQAATGPQPLLQAMSCGQCHNGRGTGGAPKAIILDGSVEVGMDTLIASNKAIWSGKMPPKSNLTADQKAVVAAELSRLLAGAPRLDETPPPPAPMPPADDNFGKPAPGGLQ